VFEFQGVQDNSFYNTQFGFISLAGFSINGGSVNGFNSTYISSYTHTLPNPAYVKPPSFFRTGATTFSKYTVINGEAGNAAYAGTNSATYGAQDFFEAFQIDGSEICWHNYNKQDGVHKIFTPCGMVYNESSVVRTAGSNSLAFAEAGFNGGGALSIGEYKTVVTFTVAATDDDTILVRGYTRKNSAYGSTSLPYIKVYTDDGYVNRVSSMTDVTDTWQLLAVYDTMQSTSALKIDVGMQALSAGATCYFDDLRCYVGDSVYSLGENWVDGYPIASPVASTIDATNVWGASTTTFTTAGTFGGVVGAYIDAPISAAGGSTDLTPVLTAIDISSNTLSAEIAAIPTVSTTTIAEGVWNAPLESYQASGSMGSIMKKIFNKCKAIFATQ